MKGEIERNVFFILLNILAEEHSGPGTIFRRSLNS